MGSVGVPEITGGDFHLPQDVVVDVEQELVDDLMECSADPLGFVMYAYPWGEGELLKSNGPYPWQREVLEHIGQWINDPATKYQPCRVAVCSGHGIGKSALIGMLIGWAMSTCEDCRVLVTANTAKQLDTKTSPEVATWFRRLINAHWWDVKQTSIKVKDRAHEKTWRSDFIPWSEENPAAFAGLHNKGKRILVIFDEASGIDKVIWETVSGAMSDEDTEIIWIAFGNATENTGSFFECFNKAKHRWWNRQIDSRAVEGTNKAEIQKDVDDYGEDSDYVRVRWRGVFPRAGFSQFIPSESVEVCRKYKAQGYEALPRILSTDVARYGDDRTVNGDRQGRKARILEKLRGLDTVQVAEHVIALIDRAEADGKPYDAWVCDGDGIGAGVIDHVRHRGYHQKLSVFEFHGGTTPQDPNKYFNRRAEVWGLTRDALSEGMEIPDDPELVSDLTAPKYFFSNKQQIQLERKEDMKKRGLASPDCGDMLAMTFAVKIFPKPVQEMSEVIYGGVLNQGWMR
jgi:hypothetical protein